ncbi:MAG: hypothetical protein AAGM22_09805 [Acidobacteriota bacterium]
MIATAITASASAQPPPAAALETEDIETPHFRLERIVAVVDDDPIFLSDLDRAARWAPSPAPSRGELLDVLIDERVRIHEVDRRGGAPAADDDVVRQLDAAPDGLDRAELEPMIRRQLRVLAYVEERLGALVFVSDEAIRAYYEKTLRPEMESRGARLPPIDDVREAIRTLLREEALERRIVAWTDELREKAEIHNWLDETLPLEALPSASLRLETPPQTEDPDVHPDRP